MHDRVCFKDSDEEGEVVATRWSLDNGDSIDVEMSDGTRRKVRPGEVTSYGAWQVPLGPEYSPWRVSPAPHGTGLALLVDRGIPCADHTQVVSRHTENVVSWRAAKMAVEKLNESLDKQVAAFCKLMQSIPYGRPEAGYFKDMAGVMFMNFLLAGIAAEAEEWEHKLLDERFREVGAAETTDGE
jgi:hypothetical protein